MVRTALRFIFGRIIELFFRRVEVAGTERVPRTGPTLFAINHPNALVDPLMLLCFAPRPVSFLAKAPLLTMPVIGWFARALDCIPVYRHQDKADMSKNRETFARARSLLERGGTIAIAPEGTSHSDSILKPLKTGAARIALGAGTAEPVMIVPVCLFYTEKATFRSEALVYFGEPLTVTPTGLDERGEPPSEVVDQVTAELRERLESVLILADEHQALTLAIRTEQLLTASLPGSSNRPLDEIRVVRQRLTAGHRLLRDENPELLTRLERRVSRLENAFRASGLDPAAPVPPPVTVANALRAMIWLILRVVLFIPLAIPGLVLHWPAYQLIGLIARRAGRVHTDVIATVKIAAAAVFYPLTWIIVGIAIGRWLGLGAGALATLIAPIAGYCALRLVERLDQFLSVTRALGFHLFRPERAGRLVAERAALRADLLVLAGQLGIEPPPR